MLMAQAEPVLIFVCGWPMSGKTELAQHLSLQLGIHYVDIDDLRWMLFGQPNPHPDASPILRARDRQEMSASYRILFDVIDWHLSASRSILVTAPLSLKVGGQTEVERLWRKYPNTLLRVVQCLPENDTPEAVACMMAKRSFGTTGGYKGAVNSSQRYFEVKDRYQPIELPHIKVQTWGSTQSIEDGVQMVIEYVLRLQPHDFRVSR